MAAGPEHVRLRVGTALTDEEALMVDGIERYLDDQLVNGAWASTNPPISVGTSLQPNIIKPGLLTPAMRAEIVRRYRAAGWSRVEFQEYRTNYNVMFGE